VGGAKRPGALRHLVKLALLLPGLAFLLWWGWSGNFASSPGDLYRLADQQHYYRLLLGGRPMGWARRVVMTDPDTSNLTMIEATLIDLAIGAETLQFKTYSRTVFDDRGRLLSADLVVPLGDVSAVVTAIAARGELKCRISLGERYKDLVVPMPPAGPVVVSGVVPWLGHQRNLPVGRPLGLELLDPSTLEFKPAQLTIEDDTAQSEEIQTWKMTLRFQSVVTIEWVDSTGLMVGQYNPSLEARLVMIQDEAEAAEAAAAIARPIQAPPGGLVAMLIDQALRSNGLGLFSDLLDQPAGPPAVTGQLGRP
jgi:hypothetical protein